MKDEKLKYFIVGTVSKNGVESLNSSINEEKQVSRNFRTQNKIFYFQKA